MEVKDAVIARIDEICKEKRMSVCDICLKGGLTPSVIYELLQGRTKYPKVNTVKRFCDGAGMTLSEFFDREYFNDFEE